jgi:hypothetical protein
MTIKKQRGGKRQGAGRKKGIITTVLWYRVPKSMATELNQIIKDVIENFKNKTY